MAAQWFLYKGYTRATGCGAITNLVILEEHCSSNNNHLLALLNTLQEWGATDPRDYLYRNSWYSS